MNFNLGWKFKREHVEEAKKIDFPISELEMWENVSLPHTLRLEKYCNSGNCGIYMGEGTYVKHFTVSKEEKNKKVFIRFEAVMGTTDVFVNGIKMHTKIADKTGDDTMYGGFLPFVLDITDALKFGEDNVICVFSDSRYDREVPPGKNSSELDFSYFGGIYRDVYLRICDRLHITDANFEDIVSGGGVLVDFPEANREFAEVYIKTHVKNEYGEGKTVSLVSNIIDENGESFCLHETPKIFIDANSDYSFEEHIKLENPELWSLKNPYLYDLISKVICDGEVTDFVHTRIGIRKIEMDHSYGLKINGEVQNILNGVNRHQEYPYIGYAAPESLQRKDAMKFKECGVQIVRTAHYPASPHFLDACDELGILIIEPTPGWQFFNESKIFCQRVKSDIRAMVRRDRNHPCILAYETVLNETKTPPGFTLSLAETAKEEHPSCKVSTENSVGEGEIDGVSDIMYISPERSQFAVGFTREYGDSYREQYTKENFFFRRAFRGAGADYCYYPGGEGAMFLQAVKRLMGNQDDTVYYCKKDGESTRMGGASGSARSYLRIAELYEKGREKDKVSHLGGTSWIGIDHNRSYADDMSACGILDLLRLPKFSYYAMASQRPFEKEKYLEKYGIETGPMIFIASYWTKKAPKIDKTNEEFFYLGTDDKRIILVYSNTKKVKLSVVSSCGEEIWSKTAEPMTGKNRNLINAPFEFLNVPYIKGSHLEASGYNKDGIRVAEHKVFTAGIPKKVEIFADTMGINPIADGSDTVMLYGKIEDKDGNVCYDANNKIKFTVLSGDAEIVGDGNRRIGANPVSVEAGIFGVYMRVGETPSEITVKVESEGLEPSKITLTSYPCEEEQCPYKKILFKGSIDDGEILTAENKSKRKNIAVGKPAFASSTLKDSSPSYSNDFNLSTAWIGNVVGEGKNAHPEYLILDLLENKVVDGVVVSLLNDSITYKYDILLSLDGETYKRVKTVQKTGQASNIADDFSPVECRFVKILFTEITSDEERGQFANAAITELQVFEH